MIFASLEEYLNQEVVAWCAEKARAARYRLGSTRWPPSGRRRPPLPFLFVVVIQGVVAELEAEF